MLSSNLHPHPPSISPLPALRKAITGGDGAPSPTRPAQYSSGVTDFDDEEEDDEDGAAVISFFADDAPSRGGDTQAVASAGSGGGGVGGCAWLLDGPGALEDAYLQLTHSVAQHSERAGRRRAAARWWGRRAELLLERGEVGIAQARLLSLADLYQVRAYARRVGARTQNKCETCESFFLCVWGVVSGMRLF